MQHLKFRVAIKGGTFGYEKQVNSHHRKLAGTYFSL